MGGESVVGFVDVVCGCGLWMWFVDVVCGCGLWIVAVGPKVGLVM